MLAVLLCLGLAAAPQGASAAPLGPTLLGEAAPATVERAQYGYYRRRYYGGPRFYGRPYGYGRGYRRRHFGGPRFYGRPYGYGRRYYGGRYRFY